MTDLLRKAFSAQTFRENGHQLVELLADYIEAAQRGDDDLPVYSARHPDALFAYWQKDLQENQGSEDVMSVFRRVIEQNIHTLHPRYVGHQVASPLPLNALADFLGSLMNSGMGVYEMGSPMVALEKVVIQTLLPYLGYPAEADGVLTSGGSLGNLTALLAARRAKAGFDSWQEGVQNQTQLAVMVSEQSHYCVNRAVKIMGLGEAGIIPVPYDENFRMRSDLLEEYYQKAQGEGKRVIAVVGNACSTATGAYDPLDQIADFCEKYDLWFHVDGAHGGAVVFSEKYKHLVKGIERADSVVLDFHKMLMTTALATALVFKDGNKGYQTFAQKADYLWENSEEREWYNLGKRTIECTKHAMSLRTFMTLRTYSTRIFADHIDYLYTLAKNFAEMIRAESDFELATAPQANILCFRYLPPQTHEANLNQVNAQIRKALIHDGEFYIVQTQVEGKLYLRTTLMNHFTREETLARLLDKIRAIYQALSSKPEINA